LFEELKEQQSTGDEEQIWQALQQYLARLEELSQRRDCRLQQVECGQTPIEEDGDLQEFPIYLSVAEAQDGGQTPTEEDDDLQEFPTYLSVAEAQGSDDDDITLTDLTGDLQTVLELDDHVASQEVPDLRKEDQMFFSFREPDEPEPDEVKFFEIMTFKRVDEVDSEAETEDTSNDRQTDISDSSRTSSFEPDKFKLNSFEPDKSADEDIHDFEVAFQQVSTLYRERNSQHQGPFRIRSPKRVKENSCKRQVSGDELDKFKLNSFEPDNSGDEGMHDFEVAFQQITTLNRERKSQHRGPFRKHFPKRVKENACKRQVSGDELDFMAMAII
jgi:hypothetical protein